MDYVISENKALWRFGYVQVSKGLEDRCLITSFLVEGKVQGSLGYKGRRKVVRCREVIKVRELSKRV